jgi:hypothetical protein
MNTTGRFPPQHTLSIAFDVDALATRATPDDARLNDVLETDRKFFERHKGRNHRIRLASEIEIELERGGVEAPPGYRWHSLLQQQRPGMRIRILFPIEEQFGVDRPEAECETLFKLACEQLKLLLAAHGVRR